MHPGVGQDFLDCRSLGRAHLHNLPEKVFELGGVAILATIGCLVGLPELVISTRDQLVVVISSGSRFEGGSLREHREQHDSSCEDVHFLTGIGHVHVDFWRHHREGAASCLHDATGGVSRQFPCKPKICNLEGKVTVEE